MSKISQSKIVSTALGKWEKAGQVEPSPLERLGDISIEALRKAGMKPADIDAIICNTTALPFNQENFITISAQHFAHRLADRIGTHHARCMNVCAACASASIALATVDTMIKSGLIDTALIGGVDNSPAGFYYQGPSVLDSDLTVSYPNEVVGITNPGYWALWARRRAHEMKKPVEDIQELMALVKELQSENAPHNPAARYQREFTEEEVFDSPMICDPLRLLMISAVSTGSGVTIVTSKEKAKEVTDKPVGIAASDVGSPVYGEPSPRLVHFATAGEEKAKEPFIEWRKPIQSALRQAGVKSEDIDIIECHDTSCFHTINWIDQIMGWDREKTDDLIREREITREGRLPVNLSGGTSAFGESVMNQAFMMINELFEQLRGEAGKRQAKKDLETGIVTAYGAYGSYGAIVLEKDW